MCFHPLTADIEPPERLNNPFCYEPHPLCRVAAQQVRAYVESQPELLLDAQKGKMLGVLVVSDSSHSSYSSHSSHSSQIGFLAAYSGLLAGRNDWDYFVPPVFDAQQPEGHFKQTERAISALNAEIAHLDTEAGRVAELKHLRKQMSEELQLWLFRQYRVLNAQGETKDLVEIWQDYHQNERVRRCFPLPPGGTGDCCAPKLLQHAYSHGLRPLAIAEFWMGESPRGEVRHDGEYYPACRGKCLPVLSFMLGGSAMNGEPQGPREPQETGGLDGAAGNWGLRVVYEDEAMLVIEKPSGLLSVPGRVVAPSVQSLLSERYGEVWMPHRLDMDTSGLMVVARTEESYKHLQRQFYARAIYKRYGALVEGREKSLTMAPKGTIALPLRPDPLDRPRQVVDRLHGKAATTDYEVTDRVGERLLLSLTPHTGRTHQLRVHCAHPEGLGMPIVGDRLYGYAVPGQRLCLHAAELAFTHPVTGRRLNFVSQPDFGAAATERSTTS